jgi:hypothetical protein
MAHLISQLRVGEPVSYSWRAVFSLSDIMLESIFSKQFTEHHMF